MNRTSPPEVPGAIRMTAPNPLAVAALPLTHNPAAAFYASPTARAVASLVRATHRVSTAAGTAVAMRLFFTPLARGRRARVRAVPAPWRAQRHLFEAGSVVTWQRGDHAAPASASSARRVLLTHGWAGDAQQMRPLGDALADAGFEPVLLDLPAHGASDGARATLPQWVRAMFAVSSTLGPWHGVVAHSLGALAGAHAVARGLAAQRIALIAASPPPALFLRWFASGLGMAETLAQRMESAIAIKEGIGVEQFAPDWLGPRLTVPALLVHDQDDRTAPIACGQALAGALKGSQMLVTRGLGHRRILEDAQVIAAVLAHLR